MLYKICKYEPNKSVPQVSYDKINDKLIFDAGRGMDYIIIRFPYDTGVELDKLKNSIETLETLLCNEYINLYGAVYARYLTGAERGMVVGYPTKTKGCNYIVLSAQRNGDMIYVYMPLNKKSVICKVPLIIKVTIRQKEEKPDRLFKAIKSMMSGERKEYMEVQFDCGSKDGYTNGDLYYTVPELGNPRIAITTKMLEKKTIYIKGNYKIEFKTRNEKVQLKVEE